MGYYLAPTRLRGRLNLRPTITVGEYSNALGAAIRTLAHAPERDSVYGFAARSLAAGDADRVVRTLSGVVRRHPTDPLARRILGIAHLHLHHLTAARTHLEVSLELLRRDARASLSLQHSLQTRLEATVVRLLLVGLYATQGRHDAARRLLLEEIAL
jgi:hypothetical protein